MRLVDVAAFAVSALHGHRIRTVLSVLGVAVGVASVVLLVSLGEGARGYVEAQFATLGGNTLVVLPGRSETTGGAPPLVGEASNPLTLADAEALTRRSPHISMVVPLVVGTVAVSHRGRERRVFMVGATPDFLPLRDLHLSAGRFLPPSDLDRGAPVVVLGRTVERELFRGENALGSPVQVGDWRMRVVGVLAAKGRVMGMDMDDLVIVPVATGLKMFNRDGLFRIVIQARSRPELRAAREDVRSILRDRHDDVEDFTLITQDAILSAFGQVLTALTMALGGIAAISLAVAGIGVMNVMLVAVSDRISEVGLLMALGARRRQVMGVFLAESILLSGLGGVVGLAAGWLGAVGIRTAFPAFPASTPPWAVAAALGVAVGVGAVFGVLPARRAARLDPVTALGRGR